MKPSESAAETSDLTYIPLTKAQWIERYGGQSLLDAEEFTVIPCSNCKDTVCNGWRVVSKKVLSSEVANETV